MTNRPDHPGTNGAGRRTAVGASVALRQSSLQSSVALGLGLGLAGLPGLAAAQAANSSPTSVSEVVVNAAETQYGAQSSDLIKLTQPLLDTPQSVTVVTRAELDDRGITTLNDALRAAPGISIGAGETSWNGNNIVLRGFTTRDDTYRDGLRDFGYYYRDPFDDESIEVLEGPSSILFGRGSTGGVIEENSKQAVIGQNFLAAEAMAGTDDTHRVTADANATLPNGMGAFRLNGMVHENDVTDRDGAHDARWGFAPTLTLTLDAATRIDLSFFHQYESDRPDYGIPWLNGKPAPVPRSNYYGFDDDYMRDNVNMLTFGVQHQFNDALQLSSRLRYSDDGRKFRTSEGVVAPNMSNAPLDSIVLNHNDFNVTDSDRLWQEDTDLTAKLNTGAVSHTLVTGFEVGDESSDPLYTFYTGVPTTRLIDPPPQTFSATGSYSRLDTQTESRFVGVYAMDTLKFGSHWEITGGVRWDRFDGHFDSVARASATATPAPLENDHVDQLPSYRVAVVYKPVEPLSLYATYGTSFDPSTEGIDSAVASGHSASVAFVNLQAETSRTYEFGYKWQATPAVMVDGSAFNIDMYNVRTPDPANSAFDILGGDQRVQGFQLEATGKITDRWDVRLGYAYLDSETTKSTPGGPLVGSPLIVTPKDTFDLVTSYQLTPKLTVGGDIQAMTDRLGMNTASSYERAPGYAIGGLFARYMVTANIKAQVNIYNITDAYYYDQPQSFHVIPGEGRTAMFTLGAKF